MSVNIGSFETEVSLESSQAAAPDRARHTMEWQEQAKLSALRARLLRDELRTRANGYDD